MTRALALTALAATFAMAQPAAAMDCGAMHDQYASAITKMSHVSAEKRAAMHRMALSGYDHCMAGDTFSAQRFFEMLAKESRGGKG